jgi:phosphoglycolate phosphatase-like HAD superfamily hydrolase
MTQFTRPVDLHRIRHVIFDFDGTLSLITGGWSDVMTDVFLEHLPLRENDGGRTFARREILQLNGRPSIQQMSRLAELVNERGGKAAEPVAYHEIFCGRLRSMVRERRAALEGGTTTVEVMLVPGARAFLETLRERGLALSLVSGSELPIVRKEAKLLGIADFFEGRIFGPEGDAQAFTKRAAIDRIVAKHAVGDGELLAFGDGPVEIQETRALGGVAIGIACVEADPLPGEIDEGKRIVLNAAGADAVLADFRAAPALFAA